MEEELQERLDEIADSTMVRVDVGKAAEAAIEQMKKKIDPKFLISDPKDIAYIVEFYNAAREFYSRNNQLEQGSQ